MAYVLVRQSTDDYPVWKSVFDEYEPHRTKAGCRRALVLRGTVDPRQLVILLEFDSLESAERYVNRPEPEEVRLRSALRGPTGFSVLVDSDAEADFRPVFRTARSA